MARASEQLGYGAGFSAASPCLRLSLAFSQYIISFCCWLLQYIVHVQQDLYSLQSISHRQSFSGITFPLLTEHVFIATVPTTQHAAVRSRDFIQHWRDNLLTVNTI